MDMSSPGGTAVPFVDLGAPFVATPVYRIV
jgi:hypothetical protein